MKYKNDINVQIQIFKYINIYKYFNGKYKHCNFFCKLFSISFSYIYIYIVSKIIFVT